MKTVIVGLTIVLLALQTGWFLFARESWSAYGWLVFVGAGIALTGVVTMFGERDADR